MNNFVSRRVRSLLRSVFRWGIAAIILYLLYHRLHGDWPIVEQGLVRLRIAWLAVGVLVLTAYFFFRIAAWRLIMRSLQLSTSWKTSARSWMNSEVIRYIPGNIWSIIARMGYAQELQGSRTTIFFGMVLEMLFLLLSAVGLAAILLLGYPKYVFQGRTAVLVLVIILSYVSTRGRLLAALLHFAQRVSKRITTIPTHLHLQASHIALVFAWSSYALFHVCITRALGFTGTLQQQMTIAGIALLAWFIGYASFLTPSGLGVREAAFAFLMTPFLSASEGILIAVLSRVAMLATEVLCLAALNSFVVAVRRKKEAAVQH